jgi:hypothetical protein
VLAVLSDHESDLKLDVAACARRAQRERFRHVGVVRRRFRRHIQAAAAAARNTIRRISQITTTRPPNAYPGREGGSLP